MNVLSVRFVVPPLGGAAPPKGGTTNRKNAQVCSFLKIA
ncbi:Uncharacterized protein dnm_099290 [Desulfonema magnum]|uniref:Uncharacterized protein n=1 Tax=Desulfonema magnum TaxID=45655 RepID=A0A975GU83_9BACT|nr:Uncharacterized protein dnm_099270 [Desulfonema magnum]QTA93821.1 Uncharacterized protein dnm_099290 [Desulfonema magnum]